MREAQKLSARSSCSLDRRLANTLEKQVDDILSRLPKDETPQSKIDLFS